MQSSLYQSDIASRRYVAVAGRFFEFASLRSRSRGWLIRDSDPKEPIVKSYFVETKALLEERIHNLAASGAITREDERYMVALIDRLIEAKELLDGSE